MSFVEREQLETQREILAALLDVRALLTRGVRYLSQIAGNTEPPERRAVSFHLSIEDYPER